jgi:hypothetical protein
MKLLSRKKTITIILSLLVLLGTTYAIVQLKPTSKDTYILSDNSEIKGIDTSIDTTLALITPTITATIIHTEVALTSKPVNTQITATKKPISTNPIATNTPILPTNAPRIQSCTAAFN